MKMQADPTVPTLVVRPEGAPSMVQDPPPRGGRDALRRGWESTRPFRPVLVLLVALSIVLAVVVDGFFTRLNLENVATSVGILWLVALGATFVQLSGGIDLSSGAVAALSGVCLGKLLEGSVPSGWAIVAVVLFGAAVGAIANGILVGIFEVNVFVVTLASMTALTGVVNLWSGANSAYITNTTVSEMATGKWLGVPSLIWLMLASLLVFLFVQVRTYFGRDIYAVGGSVTAARLSGIRTARTLVSVYALAGGMAALAGVIGVGRLGAAVPQPDTTLPLNAIAAILIGGTALTGGTGSVVGTALGVLFIGVLENGLSLSGVSTYWQQIATGTILAVAVLGNRVSLPSLERVRGRTRRKVTAATT